ncbi:hypothetical protein [Candidatus Poriferisodalis sp.]|uniref:hypothetical protein n=1 Tax=Candidatus Poriferisodalis sp. TaxID=3101277 RepID=UPI003B020903
MWTTNPLAAISPVTVRRLNATDKASSLLKPRLSTTRREIPDAFAPVSMSTRQSWIAPVFGELIGKRTTA